MLDSNTKLGRKATQSVMRALNELGRRKEIRHLWFPEGNTLPVDGFISYLSGEIAGIFEAKSRKLKLNTDNGKVEYDGKEYPDLLISKSKIEEGARYAKQFSLPFYLLVYCELSGHVLSFRVANESGEVIVNYTERRSKTQASVNGSTATRMNAYIPIDGQAKVWKTKLFVY